VLVILAHQRRRVVHVAVTAHPTAAWTAQRFREAFPEFYPVDRSVHVRREWIKLTARMEFSVGTACIAFRYVSCVRSSAVTTSPTSRTASRYTAPRWGSVRSSNVAVFQAGAPPEEDARMSQSPTPPVLGSENRSSTLVLSADRLRIRRVRGDDYSRCGGSAGEPIASTATGLLLYGHHMPWNPRHHVR
jgi:hypothetical protein